MKIYLVAGYKNYINWIKDAELTEDIKEADLVLFEGGEDVYPLLYGQESHPTTSYNINRDTRELFIFEIAKALNKPMLGICRGSQFLCTRAGGKLIQHQNNPGHTHTIKTYDNQSFETTSTHHQAQNPFNLPKKEYKILGWSEGIIKFKEDGNGDVINEKDVEVAYYPKINALCIQPHPEMRYHSEANLSIDIIWYRGVLNKFMKGEL